MYCTYLDGFVGNHALADAQSASAGIRCLYCTYLDGLVGNQALADAQSASAGIRCLYCTYLDGFVGVYDDGHEEVEDQVDEEADEGIQVDAAVEPDEAKLGRGLDNSEGDEHVVTIHEREERL